MKKYYNIQKEIFLIHKIQAFAYSKERKSLQGYINYRNYPKKKKKCELDQQRNENKTEQKPIMK